MNTTTPPARGLTAALYVAAMALLAACSGTTPTVFTRTIAGTPVAAPAPPASGITTTPPAGTAPEDTTTAPPGGDGEIAPGVRLLPGEEALVDAHRTARRIDPCALHDPTVATNVTRLTPNSLMPDNRGLHVCTLEVIADTWDLPAWKLQISVGVDFDNHQREKTTQETVDGATVFRKNTDTDTGAGKDACSYLAPLGEKTAIELTVRRGGGKPRPEQPCQIAVEYLGAVIGFWRDPALRGDQVSTPTLRLADLDPCVGITAAATTLAIPGTVALAHPYSCSLMPTPGPEGASALGERVSVELRMEADPKALLDGPSGDLYTAVTVRGKPGLTTQDDTGGQQRCQAIVTADTDTTVIADHARAEPQQFVQTISVQAGDCDTATTAANAVLATLD